MPSGVPAVNAHRRTKASISNRHARDIVLEADIERLEVVAGDDVVGSLIMGDSLSVLMSWYRGIERAGSSPREKWVGRNAMAEFRGRIDDNITETIGATPRFDDLPEPG